MTATSRCRTATEFISPATTLPGQRGGSGGIRTPGPSRDARFQGECIRPLCHASSAVRVQVHTLARTH